MGDLEEELNEIAGHLNAQHARLAVLTRELLDHPDAWASDGIWTVSSTCVGGSVSAPLMPSSSPTSPDVLTSSPMHGGVRTWRALNRSGDGAGTEGPIVG